MIQLLLKMGRAQEPKPCNYLSVQHTNFLQCSQNLYNALGIQTVASDPRRLQADVSEVQSQRRTHTQQF